MIKSLSIVFPIYNEETRLQSSFNHIVNFLKTKKNFKTQIIFVDDGSEDNSLKLLQEFVKNIKKYKIKYKATFIIVKSKKNLGKGSALKLGIKKAQCEWVLTSDIDMSVPLSQLLSWIKRKLISNKCFVYFGTRSHSKSVVKRDFFRKILGDIASFLISTILNIEIEDTQCGFKLYKRKQGQLVFSKLINKGFDHDIEIVLILKSKNIGIKELPVKWTHRPNSKVNIFVDPIKMFVGLFIMRLRFF